jgi:hypothetical protein
VRDGAADRAARPVAAYGAVVLAVAIGPLFLHVDWQPGFSIDVGSTSVAVELADLALAAVVVAAVAAARARGAGVLRAALPLWAAAGAFVAWVIVATLYGPAMLEDYPVLENLVTAAKLAEYAALAVAVPLLVRERDELGVVLVGLVGWCVLATAVAVAQFLGWDAFDAWSAGRRQPSFLGHHDFAALSGAVLLVGLASLALSAGPLGRLQAVALAAGGLGFVLAASSAGLAGLAAAVLVLGVLSVRARRPLRRIAWAFALSGAVAVGVLALRGGDVADFLDFAADEQRTGTEQVESYSQRTVLAYIGGRIFLDHPVLGVGWQGSAEPEAFEPYLDDARRRFPDEAELAFPSAQRLYGVQNAYIQALADLGVVGLALLLGTLGSGLWLGLRAALGGSAAGVLALLWLLLALGVWLAQGLVTGIPLAALTWFALGLAAVGAAEGRRA